MQILKKVYAHIILSLFAQSSSEIIKQVRAVLNDHISEGHTRIALAEIAVQLNGLNLNYLRQLILRFCPDLVIAEDHLTTNTLCWAERIIADRLKIVGSKLRKIAIPTLREYFTRNHPELSEQQREAAIGAVNSPFSLLIGGPGTGKTTTLKAILGALETFGYSVSLAAPTGRAAERMTEATGHFAQTIHRMLYFSPRESKWLKTLLGNRRDAIAVDEFSMMDTVLTAKLLSSASPYTRIIALGDSEQLPSIGPGAVLRDLIACGQVNVCRLSQTHRQAGDSKIVELATAMRHGRSIDWVQPGQGKSDVYLIHAPNDFAIAASVGKALKSLAGRLGYQPNTDIQILTTIHKGVAGTNNLNKVARQALVGEQAVYPFAIGDRVLHTKNNRRLRISNGNVGIITSVSAGCVMVQYPHRSLRYNRKEQAELTHAHAMTVYKAQGSEFKVTIIPLSESQARYWNRPLLLTAASRPKELLIFIGSEKVYEAAMSDTSPYERNTGLVAAITQVCVG
ncbi:MAG: AAA family ATPase [Acidobacteria bacterium]|nr:AAA family ATPase [Acidobacteriota bacterium]